MYSSRNGHNKHDKAKTQRETQKFGDDLLKLHLQENGPKFTLIQALFSSTAPCLSTLEALISVLDEIPLQSHVSSYMNS